jgi:hypothetical protein
MTNGIAPRREPDAANALAQLPFLSRLSAEGGVPNSRRNARLMRSGSPNPQCCAISCIDLAPLSSNARAASARSLSTALAGVTPVWW